MADRTSPTESGVGSCCQLFPHNVSSPKPRLHNRGEWSVSGSCAAADDGRPGVSRGPGAVLVGNGGKPTFAASWMNGREAQEAVGRQITLIEQEGAEIGLCKAWVRWVYPMNRGRVERTVGLHRRLQGSQAYRHRRDRPEASYILR